MLKKNVTHYYNTVAEEYDVDFYQKPDPYPPLRYRHNYILAMIGDEKFSQNCKVLDVGCCPGEMVCDLAANNLEVWGIDISEKMIAVAQEKVSRKFKDTSNIHLELGDIEDLSFPDQTFDLIICADVVEYPESDEKWISELFRVLKPEGILILNVTNRFAVRRWSLFAVEKLKSVKLFYAAMNFAKQKILKKGGVVRFPFKPRTHSPSSFDRFLIANGFEKISHNYFAFSIMPYPLDTLLSFISVPIRKYMENFSSRNMILFGTGYIVKVRKKNMV